MLLRALEPEEPEELGCRQLDEEERGCDIVFGGSLSLPLDEVEAIISED